MRKIIRPAVLNCVIGNNLWARCQHGLREGLSCLTNSIARKDWITAKDGCIPVVTIFIDLGKFFTKVSHIDPKLRLESFRIPYEIINQMSVFCSDRKTETLQRISVILPQVMSWPNIGLPYDERWSRYCFVLSFSHIWNWSKTDIISFMSGVLFFSLCSEFLEFFTAGSPKAQHLGLFSSWST